MATQGTQKLWISEFETSKVEVQAPKLYRGGEENKQTNKNFKGKNEFLLYKFNPVTLS